jgi:Tfp pilus assembly protein PilF
VNVRVGLLVVAAMYALSRAAVSLAAPYVPGDDAVVLERLPEKADPSLKALKRLRAALAADPDNLDLAAPLARRAIAAARETGDPRFLGQAQAALAPWWSADDPPATALLLRATIKQSQHDFAGALRDLDQVLILDPGNGQARLTRATVLTVQGRYAEALVDCTALVRRATPLVIASCVAAPASLSGDDERAYAALVAHIEAARDDATIRAWALTLAAEIAARRGDAAAAQRHFAAALAVDPADAYLKAAYADFLLERLRADAALALVAGDTRNDALLLRTALAEQQIAQRRAAYLEHRSDLAARFDAARRRGDSMHQREEARYRLTIENDASGALVLAKRNWAVQREPADLLILAQAARAANDAPTLQLVRDWINATKLRDVRIAAALEAS